MNIEFAGHQYRIPDACHVQNRKWATSMLNNFGAEIFLSSDKLRRLAPCVLDNLKQLGATVPEVKVEPWNDPKAT